MPFSFALLRFNFKTYQVRKTINQELPVNSNHNCLLQNFLNDKEAERRKKYARY